MNFELGREIYGGNPWCMDTMSFLSMSSILSDIRNGVNFDNPDVRLNSPQLYSFKGDAKIIDKPFGNSWEKGQLETSEDFDGIGLLNLNGPITVSGGASSMGMEQLSSLALSMASDDRVKAFVIPSNSGGGSSAAVSIMSDTINKIKNEFNKPVYALVKKGGTACSACYGIISACTAIYSESGMNIVGSIGTMIQFEGREANSKSSDGVKHIKLYATKSVSKNKEFEEAINNDNYELLINNLLDPINNEFISTIESNRPLIKSYSGFDNGQTMFSKDAVGTFIDGIASFDEVVSMIEDNINININNKQMNREDFQSKHPDVYQEAVNEGVKKERVRVNTYMAHSSTDLEVVRSGIKSGEPLSDDVREELMVKASKQKMLGDMKSSNNQDLNPDSSIEKTELTAEQKELEQVKNLYNIK